MLINLGPWIGNLAPTIGARAFHRVKCFEKLCHANLLHNLRSLGILCKVFYFISFFPGSRKLDVVLNHVACSKFTV